MQAGHQERLIQEFEQERKETQERIFELQLQLVQLEQIGNNPAIEKAKVEIQNQINALEDKPLVPPKQWSVDKIHELAEQIKLNGPIPEKYESLRQGLKSMIRAIWIDDGKVVKITPR